MKATIGERTDVMKKSSYLIVAFVFCCLILLTACQQSANNAQQGKMENWLFTANLDAEETSEELYEEALSEDTLVIYTTTTRIYMAIESFGLKYPGLTVEVHEAKAVDIADILLENYQNGNYHCDVVIAGDDRGLYTGDLSQAGIINTYIPYDIKEHILPQNQDEKLDFVKEAQQLFYNSEVYDSSPISNWWELTEPQWYGKVLMNSPTRSEPSFSLLHAILANPKVMEEAYEAHYGESPNIPEGSNAGKLFYQKLVENGLIITTSSNDVVDAIGTVGQKNPPVGFMISSKVRRTEIGLAIAPVYGVLPWDGVYSPNSIFIASGSKNINSAKLFTRWLLGETDGKGEGLKPYLLEGAWPVRNDVNIESSIAFDDLNIYINNKDDVIKNRDEILEFWQDITSTHNN